MKERIKKIRRLLDLTQQEFADKIGVKRNTIAQYESGRNEPTETVMILICREFNVNEKWLRNGNGEMFNKTTREEEIADWMGKILRPENDTSFQSRFISVLSKLNERDWETLEKIATSFIEENKKD